MRLSRVRRVDIPIEVLTVMVSVLAMVTVAAVRSNNTGGGEGGGVDAGNCRASGRGMSTATASRYQTSIQEVELDLSKLWFFLMLFRQREGPLDSARNRVRGLARGGTRACAQRGSATRVLLAAYRSRPRRHSQCQPAMIRGEFSEGMGPKLCKVFHDNDK